jgi:NADH-quinone oxidoreductase subunit J
MNIATVLFYLFEGIAAAAAVGIILIRNVFYGALLLIVCLLSIAGIYVLSFAEFIAVSQILVYAGGVLVVVIFGIMLTSKISGKSLVVTHKNWVAGLAVSGFFFVLLAKNLLSEIFTTAPPTSPPSQNTFQAIGILLMSDFILPFELAGILLLLTLIGSAVTASYIKPKE